MKIIETRRAPNPRRVRIFLAEKGIEVAYEEIELVPEVLGADGFRALNPFGRVPVLVLDDGTAISETVAICRYFEEVQPEPALFGFGAKGRAIVEMWNRRVELGLFQHLTHAFRHLNPKMAPLEQPQIAAWGEANKPKVLAALEPIDRHLSSSRFLAGETYSIADITLLAAVDFMKPGKLSVPEALTNVHRWHREVSARPSAGA